MKVIKKSAEQITLLREGGGHLATILLALKAAVKPGVTGLEIDVLAQRLIRQVKAEPAFLGYQGFPAAVCISPESEVVHGIPNATPLREGQIVGLDLGLFYRGLYTDAAITVPVGKIDHDRQRLLEVTEEALMNGIRQVRPNVPINTVALAVQQTAETAGFGVVRELVGHGVGLAIHEEPNVPNFVSREGKQQLEAGMVIAIEPMVNLGKPGVMFSDDGWTVTTGDGLPSAHFEHSVAVTDSGYLILTLPTEMS